MIWLQSLDPRYQALLGGLFTWLVTAIGALTVIFSGREVGKRPLAAMLGFASGVMIAASFWSLLAPAVEIAESQGQRGWLPASVGFLLGAVFLRLTDLMLPHIHPWLRGGPVEGVRTHWRRSTLLILAITLHNIPEGLAVGVAFGAAAGGGSVGEIASFSGAVALALGIGIQNFPEGMAVSMPLRGAGVSRMKSFWYGTMSALVEPIAAVLGAAAVLAMKPILPYALAFAAGAMIFVVVEELIPESQDEGNGDLATSTTMIGFVTMMVLDVALG